MGWDKWSDTIENCNYITIEDKIKLLSKHKQEQIKQKLEEKYGKENNKTNRK